MKEFYQEKIKPRRSLAPDRNGSHAFCIAFSEGKGINVYSAENGGRVGVPGQTPESLFSTNTLKTFYYEKN